MTSLTQKQRQILDFLHDHFKGHGYWPSIREIQDAFQFRSTNAVFGHLRALERKEAIERHPGTARAYRLKNSPDIELLADNDELVSVPIYGSIAAGYPDGIESGGEIGRIQVDAQTACITRGGKPFALKVRGESMIKAGILDADTVIVEPGEPRNGDIVAALIDGETTLKRFICERGKSAYLKAENDDYPELYPVGELMIQGIAKSIVRSL